MEKWRDKVVCFLQETFLVKNPAWRLGLLVGVGAGVGWTVLSSWNKNLSVMINISHILERFLFSIVTPPFLIAEKDIFRINLFRKLYTILPLRPSTKMKSISDIIIPSPEGHNIPATVFAPVSQTCDEVSRPIIIYMHGGGFVIGDVSMYTPITTTLASETGFIVVSIEYRRAPENKFPAAHADCAAAIRWIHENSSSLGGHPDKIAVIGDSAGGNLAACMACQFPDIIKLSIPVYPVITFGTCSQSKVENYNMPILPSAMMDWFSCRYFNGPEDLNNPIVCPLRRSHEELSKVPRTHVVTAQYDVLRDEGIAYVNALKSKGVSVTHKNYDNTVHGFYGVVGMTHGSQALIDTACIIREHFT